MDNISCSYKVDSIGKVREVEINRLKGQVELFWEKEYKHYQEFGLKDGMTILEIGSGPGFLTEKLLEALPNSFVYGVEIDPGLVEYSDRYLKEKGHDRFKIYNGSATDLGNIVQDCDFAITRLVLEHLPDPLKAVKEIYRSIKPKGKAVFIDNDFEMHLMTYPVVSKLRELYDAYCTARLNENGNPKLGRELPILLEKAGFINIDFEAICVHSAIKGKESFQNSEGIGIPSKLVEDGYLKSKTLAEISVGWRQMIKSEESAIIRQLYLAVGERRENDE
ncbi:MAG: methyltransferase domain-containing protein [Clostridia bacterium]|nr:methyltransferase domain-containing protein [Clostridia bacterium]